MLFRRKNTQTYLPQVPPQHVHHRDPILVDAVIWISNELDEVSLHRRIINKSLIILTVLVILEVIAQLLYPSTRALPRAEIHGQQFSFAKVKDIEQEVKDNQMILELKASTLEPAPATASKLGLNTDAAATASRLASYPVLRRLIPFSILSKHTLESSIKHVDEQKLEAYMPKLQEQFSAQPVDAAIDIEDGKVIVTSEQNGWQIDTQSALSKLKQAAKDGSASVALTTEPLPANVKAENLVVTAQSATKILSRNITVTTGSAQHQIPVSEISKWIVFDRSESGEQVHLNDSQIAAYLTQFKGEVESKSLGAKAQVVDNKVSITEQGKPGTMLDMAKTTEAIKAALLGDAADTEVKVATIQSSVPTAYDYSYSATNEGLTALLTNSIKGRGGRYGVGAQALSGSDSRYGLVNDSSVVIASIYKLFIADVLFDRLGNSSLQWSSKLNTGQTISDCFERMIVVSDNRCAVAIGQEIGWNTLDTTLAEKGYKHTRLNNYNANGTFNGNKFSSPSDVLLLLRRLYDGNFAKPELNEVLLSAMKRQIYRKGIPAGVKGPVADKVGFIDKYINDAGIVYGANTRYSLVVLTSGSSWSNVAAIAKQVDNYFGN